MRTDPNYPKGTKLKDSQDLVMVRCRVRVIGGKRFAFWQAEGCKPHIGRGCNMKAMGDAVRTARVYSTVEKP